MKLKRFILVALVLMPLSVFAQEKWQKGEHYTQLNDTASQTKQVREIFSFWCPHCFTFEPIAKQLKQQLPANVTFTKAHVNFLGSASQDAQNDATLAMLAAKAMGQDDVFITSLFNAIHKERKGITGLDDMLAVFAAAGGDSEKLKKLTSSFGIKSQVARNNKLIQGFRSVPAFVVNDKYQANFTRDMTPDQFVELIIWLTNKD